MGMLWIWTLTTWICAFRFFKADFLRRLLLCAASVPASFRSYPGAPYELDQDQQIPWQHDSNRHRKAYKQDVFELEVRSGLSSIGFCGGIYGDCWLNMVTIPCFWPYYVPQQVIMWGVLIPDSEGCLNAGYYYWFLQTVVFASSQSLLCALHLLDKGISWLIPLITLFFKDGHGDKVVCILEIRNFGLAVLYHIKN